MTIFITGNSRTGTTLLLALFGLSGLDAGYNKELLKRYTSANYRRQYYDIRGGLDFYYDKPAVIRARTGDYPEVFKHAYCLNYKCLSPKAKAESLSCVHPETEATIITYRASSSNIESFVNMQLRRQRPHSWTNEKQAYKEVSECYERNTPILKEEFPNAIWLEFPKYTTDFEYFYGEVGHLFPIDRDELFDLYTEHVSRDMVRY